LKLSQAYYFIAAGAVMSGNGWLQITEHYLLKMVLLHWTQSQVGSILCLWQFPCGPQQSAHCIKNGKVNGCCGIQVALFSCISSL
jgi:hypothetical protein